MFEGIHKARVVKTWLAKSASKGTPYVNIKADIEDDDGKSVSGWVPLWMSKKTMGKAKKHLGTLGFDMDKQDLKLLDKASELLAGKEFEVEAKEETYNNEKRIKFQFPMGDSPLSENEISELQAAARAPKKSEDADVPEEPKKTAAKRGAPRPIDKDIAEHKADVEAHKDDEAPF